MEKVFARYPWRVRKGGDVGPSAPLREGGICGAFCEGIKWGVGPREWSHFWIVPVLCQGRVYQEFQAGSRTC